MEWFITSKFANQTIRSFLKDEQAFSRRILKAIISEDGYIRLNGSIVKLNQLLSEGDHLEVKFPREEKGAFMKAERLPLTILYEDEFLLVIDKPAYMATIPSRHHPHHTLANGVLGYYEEHAIPYTVHIVTRLDKGTSGLVLVAKHRYSHSLLSTMQWETKIKRRYQALVAGHLSDKVGSIKKNIGRKDGSIIERTVRVDGQEAVTHYQVIKETLSHTLVDIDLETGRTHQIRVHFSFIGHPLLGDDLYGGKNGLINRQALHCSQLSFFHPFTQKKMVVNSELPSDMKRLL